MIIMLLGYVFLVVFTLTALLTLLSIPGWITIPEKYRDTLFKTLIIEVIGVVITLFTNSYLARESDRIQFIDDNLSWVALDVVTGNIVHPSFKIDVNDSIIEHIPHSNSSFANLELSAKVEGNFLSIYTNDSFSIGTIQPSKINELGLFNTIKSDGGTISSLNNFSLIKFQKNTKSSSWYMKGQLVHNSPFDFQLKDHQKGGISYQILKNGVVLFDSNSRSASLFDVDNRLIHIYESNGVFYMFRITEADLNNEKQYVNVLQIRLDPQLNL